MIFRIFALIIFTIATISPYVGYAGKDDVAVTTNAPKTPVKAAHSSPKPSTPSNADLNSCELNLSNFFDSDSEDDCPQTPKGDGDWASEFLAVETMIPGESREAFFERLKVIIYEKYRNGDSHIIDMCKSARTEPQVRILLQEIARQAAIAIPDEYSTPKRRGTTRHRVCATILTTIQEADKENTDSSQLTTPIRRARVEQPFIAGRSATKRKGAAIPDVYVEYRKPGVTPSPKTSNMRRKKRLRKPRGSIPFDLTNYDDDDVCADELMIQDEDCNILSTAPGSPYRTPTRRKKRPRTITGQKDRYRGCAYDYKFGNARLQKKQKEHNKINLATREGVEFKGTFEIKE